MNVADKIYELVKAMPEEKANEILDFAEFLQYKSSVQVQQAGQLKPLPTLQGYVPSEWKDAIYEEGV
jgi:hypothetical protein